MRLPVQLFLRSGQLWRRYLPLTTCRLGLLAKMPGVSPAWPVESLLRRGLSLG